MAEAPLAIWQALNDRQRAYLREAFTLNQETEASVASRRARGWYDETPASVWRWLRYGYVHGVVARPVSRSPNQPALRWRFTSSASYSPL